MAVAVGVTCEKCGKIYHYPTSKQLHETGICFVCKPDLTNGLEVATGPDVIPLVAPAMIHGVGKDAPTTVNEHGGKQSGSPYRADLLPGHALLAVAAVMKLGADKYGADNWHAITAAENINHAMVHLLARRAGDSSDDHLEHAACRILFALDQVLSGRDAKLTAKV